MIRCCDGETYVVPNGPQRGDVPRHKHALKTLRSVVPDDVETHASWAVLCCRCDAVLAIVDGPRDEVYSWL